MEGECRTPQYIGVKIIEAVPNSLIDYRIAKYGSEKAFQMDSELPLDSQGYYVRYSDGYVSWSPKDVFEKAYRPIKLGRMTFGLAIEALKQGRKVSRDGWNGKGLSLELQVPDANSKMTLPYIYLSYPSSPASETAPANHINAKVPWLASQTDMLAEDWYIVD